MKKSVFSILALFGVNLVLAGNVSVAQEAQVKSIAKVAVSSESRVNSSINAGYKLPEEALMKGVVGKVCDSKTAVQQNSEKVSLPGARQIKGIIG